MSVLQSLCLRTVPWSGKTTFCVPNHQLGDTWLCPPFGCCEQWTASTPAPSAAFSTRVGAFEPDSHHGAPLLETCQRLSAALLMRPEVPRNLWEWPCPPALPLLGCPPPHFRPCSAVPLLVFQQLLWNLWRALTVSPDPFMSALPGVGLFAVPRCPPGFSEQGFKGAECLLLNQWVTL